MPLANDAFGSEYLLDESDFELLDLPDDLSDLGFHSYVLQYQQGLSSSKEVREDVLKDEKFTTLAVTATKCLDKKEKTKSNTWRQRKRLELLRLRDEVKQLDDELKGMKMAIGVHSTLPLTPAGTGHTNLTTVRKLIGESWQDAASRESLTRKISAAENEQLRRVMQTQVIHARKLQRLLKQRLATVAVEKAIGFRHTMAYECRFGPPRDNHVVFQRLLAQFDEQVGDVAASCLEKDTRVWINDVRGLQVQLMDQYHVPFSLEATEQAIWKRLSRQGMDAKKDSIIYDELFDSDSSTKLQSVRVFAMVDTLELSLLIRKACRKYVESGRTYFVLHEVTTVTTITGVTISFEETLWRVVKPKEESAGLPSVIIETHVLATFPSYKAVACLPPSSLTQWHSSIMHFNHTIEDMLIKRGRKP